MEKILLTVGMLALMGSILYIQNQPVEEAINIAQAFQSFKTRFNKAYATNEEAYRLAVYAENMKYIREYNARKGRKVFGETRFVDLTDEEFASTYLTLKVDEEEAQGTFSLQVDPNVDSIDWVAKGAVTHIKDQGQCGSCWTFGTTGVLEGHYFVTTGDLPDLAEQQLLDCSKIVDLNLGCNGGMPSRALNYVKRNGITTQSGYPIPYAAKQSDSCLLKGGNYHVTGHTKLAATEEALIAQLQKQPVSVTVDATNWKYYSPDESGLIFDDCETTLNHAVLAVGFDASSIKIKNSWSASWGSSGFIYLKRGQNTCGVWENNVVPTTN